SRAGRGDFELARGGRQRGGCLGRDGEATNEVGRAGAASSMSPRRRPGPTTTAGGCFATLEPQQFLATNIRGYGSRIALAEPVIGRAFARPVGSLVRDDD